MQFNERKDCMKKLILIITSSDEPNIKNVIPFLEKMEEKFVRINTDEFFSDGFGSLCISGKEWSLSLGKKTISEHDVKSIWYRRPYPPKYDEKIHPLYRGFVRNESSKFFTSAWSMFSRKNILWINSPERLAFLEFNKSYQMFMASRVGLNTPKTLISNNPSDILNFFDECNGNVVVKIFGGTGCILDEQGRALTIYTHRITRDDIINHREEITQTPSIFQEYVSKKIELRITIVGCEIFSCGIYSQDSERTKDDWRRYDFMNVKHEVINLPLNIVEKLHAFMKELDLVFGAIDMILTPSGEYVFLEVNPSGQWGWIESITNMPISESLAHTLSRGMTS